MYTQSAAIGTCELPRRFRIRGRLCMVAASILCLWNSVRPRNQDDLRLPQGRMREITDIIINACVNVSANLLSLRVARPNPEF
jgi:hypothetical protein